MHYGRRLWIMTKVKLAGSQIAKSVDLRSLSQKNDEEFNFMQKRTFGDQDLIIREEMENFRRARNQMNYQKNDEEKLVDRFFAEIHYKNENEMRAKNDIYEIKDNIYTLERTMATGLDIEKKREFKKLLQEREILYNVEQELFRDTLEFKNLYDKWEYDRISGKRLGPDETKEKLTRMNLLKAKKEQVDYDRNRIRSNILKIKNGQLNEIDAKISGLLSKELKNPNANYTNLRAFSLDGMKNHILDEAERVRNLRVYTNKNMLKV